MQQKLVAQLLCIGDVGADGARTQVKLKVVDLGVAGLWWQAWEAFDELCRHRDRLGVNKVITKHIGNLHLWHACFGWVFEDLISRSRKPADALDMDAADSLRKSWSLSSLGVLLLLWWGRCQERSLRGDCCRYLAALIDTLQTDGDVAPQRLWVLSWVTMAIAGAEDCLAIAVGGGSRTAWWRWPTCLTNRCGSSVGRPTCCASAFTCEGRSGS